MDVSAHQPAPELPPPRRRIGGLSLLMAGAVAAGLIGAAVFGSSGNDEPVQTVATVVPPPGAPTAGLAPEVSVDLFFDQGTFRLTDHIANDGRPVILNLWASWCYPCRAEMPELSAVAERHPEIVMVGVAVEDTLAASLAFAEEVQVSYLIAHDATGQVDARYPAPGLPATYAITGDGELVRVVYGRVYEDQVEAMIAELMAISSAP